VLPTASQANVPQLCKRREETKPEIVCDTKAQNTHTASHLHSSEVLGIGKGKEVKNPWLALQVYTLYDQAAKVYKSSRLNYLQISGQKFSHTHKDSNYRVYNSVK